MTLFRVDFGAAIGFGHLMRSLVYAKNFDEVIYISTSDKRALLPYKLITIANEEAFFKEVEKLQPSEVVVDNYTFTLEDEKAFKKRFSTIKLSVFDDDYRAHHCDEIINHNISADINRYPHPEIVKIIPPLIREEFHKEKRIKREKLYDIFVAMGATDTSNITLKILKTLPKDYKVVALTTSANQDLEALQSYCAAKSNITLHVDSNILARLMNQSRFAIVTPSVILHEVIYMDIPFLAIKTADNQEDIYNYLKRHNYPTLNGFNADLLKKYIENLL